ncbi:hypothetical protein ITJ68_16140 [Curtobacterium sp. VKM Ac-1395]|nr:hypothetical protein [Curtobacterium sp. VKM Ac-1395]
MKILGRPGSDRSAGERSERMQQVGESVGILVDRLSNMTDDELGDYLRLDVLREVLDRRVGQVGRYERSVFSEAFKVLVDEDFTLVNLEPCWRAA